MITTMFSNRIMSSVISGFSLGQITLLAHHLGGGGIDERGFFYLILLCIAISAIISRQSESSSLRTIAMLLIAQSIGHLLLLPTKGSTTQMCIAHLCATILGTYYFSFQFDIYKSFSKISNWIVLHFSFFPQKYLPDGLTSTLLISSQIKSGLNKLLLRQLIGRAPPRSSSLMQRKVDLAHK